MDLGEVAVNLESGDRPKRVDLGEVAVNLESGGVGVLRRGESSRPPSTNSGHRGEVEAMTEGDAGGGGWMAAGNSSNSETRRTGRFWFLTWRWQAVSVSRSAET